VCAFRRKHSHIDQIRRAPRARRWDILVDLMDGASLHRRGHTGSAAHDLAQEADLTLPAMTTALRRVALTASLCPIVAGLLVLGGWILDVEILKRIVNGLTAMNPATAVGFICLGSALALTSRRGAGRIARGAAITLGLAAAALGVGRLLAVAGVYDAGVDRLLFAEKLVGADFGRPNQMAPNTAVNFILIGLALVLIDVHGRRIRWPGQLMAVTAGMSSLLALIGYAYGLPAFYGIGTHIAMSLPTALTFLVTSTGILCARPTHGIIAVVSGDTSGGTMIRRLLPAVIVVPVVLGGLRLAGHRVLLFESAVGLWLLVISIMTVFAVLIGWNALLLHRVDIDRARHERLLAHQAQHDALTELPNRRLFLEQLGAAIARGRDSGVFAAVLFVDLDLFKVINDSLGHVVGDDMLIAAGARVRENVGPHALVARLGGDEFTVLLGDLTDRACAIETAERIRTAFERPFAVGVHEVFTSVSIGIAFTTREDSAQDVLRHADLAMYHAKSRGRSRVEVFDPALDLAARTRQQLEYDLRRAIPRGELRVFYQPEVEIDTGRLVGLEALVRWEHPVRGLIAPAAFLSVAEESGLIVPIGRWVMYEACRQAKEWQLRYDTDTALMVSVNLSGKHMQQATLIDEVREVLEKTGMDPQHLIIEITETVAMAGAETTIEILKKLKGLGVLLAIDDFGTGFSSLAYLKRFPVDLLKIDKSFVDGVAFRNHDRAIVEAIIALGHALGLRVIAEGVEGPEQLEELRSLGSELGQGYFFGKPLSSDRTTGMPSLLDAHRRWAADRPH
jgi:diguanylate cyclase (GGDEF)-like protein